MNLFNLTLKTMIHSKYIIILIILFFLTLTINFTLEMGVEFYSGLAGIFIFGELLRYEKYNKTEHFIIPINKAKIRLLFTRISISIIYVSFANVFLYFMLNNILNSQSVSDNSMITFIASGIITSIFFGMATLLVGFIFKNWIVGLLLILLYWSLWTVGCFKYPDSILNPFKLATEVSGGLELKLNCIIFIILIGGILAYKFRK